MKFSRTLHPTPSKILLLCFHLAAFAARAQQPPAAPAPDASLRGRVLDARSGEPVAKVKIVVTDFRQEATTDERGAYAFENLPAGEVKLYITTISYGLVKTSVRLQVGENQIDISLNQEAATLAERVTVTADSGAYGEVEPNAPSEQIVNKAELRSLSTVLLGDPVRASQALPSLAANDDFRSEFSARGAGFDRIGLFIDGVLIDSFIHTVQGGYPDSGSLSVLNADTIGAITLFGGAFPAKYGYRNAAVLSAETREGNRVRPAARVAASFSNVSGVIDGPFGANSRGSYLFAARKSYLAPLVRRVNRANDIEENGFVFDFADSQAKAIYDFSERHSVGLSAVFGDSRYDRDVARELLGRNTVRDGDTRNLLVNAHWNYTPSARFFSQTRLFGVRNNFVNENRDAQELDRGARRQIGARGDLSFIATGAHRVEGGFYWRSLRENRSGRRYFGGQPFTLFAYDRGATEPSFYAQDSWSDERRGVTLTGGLRIDHSSREGDDGNGGVDETLFSPRAALGWRIGNAWRVRAGFGRYVQFADFEKVFGALGDPGRRLRAARAIHYNASVERSFGERTRAVVEAYDREERDLFFSLSEPRVEAGRVNFAQSPFRNSLRGHGRGVEISLQRRSANNLTGWVSYAYSRTELRDATTNLTFPSDFDQRHTFNLFASYRFTETFNLSGQWRVGSGYPVPGFYSRSGDNFFLSERRNATRIPTYGRADLRASKAFLFKKSKLTLNAEVLNLFNRANLRYSGFDGYGANGVVFGRLDRTLPILPSVGAAFEF